MTQAQMTAYLADKIGISKGQAKSTLAKFSNTGAMHWAT